MGRVKRVKTMTIYNVLEREPNGVERVKVIHRGDVYLDVTLGYGLIVYG